MNRGRVFKSGTTLTTVTFEYLFYSDGEHISIRKKCTRRHADVWFYFTYKVFICILFLMAYFFCFLFSLNFLLNISFTYSRVHVSYRNFLACARSVSHVAIAVFDGIVLRHVFLFSPKILLVTKCDELFTCLTFELPCVFSAPRNYLRICRRRTCVNTCAKP